MEDPAQTNPAPPGHAQTSVPSSPAVVSVPSHSARTAEGAESRAPCNLGGGLRNLVYRIFSGDRTGGATCRPFKGIAPDCGVAGDGASPEHPELTHAGTARGVCGARAILSHPGTSRICSAQDQ